MFARWIAVMSVLAVVTLPVTGCLSIPGISGLGGSEELEGVVADVAAKAVDVASEVGGADGFGGTRMDGYLEHMPLHLGFRGEVDLAPSGAGVMIRLRNQAGERCQFHLSYFASHMGLEDEELDVDVEAGEEVTVDLPCSEIVGVGPLERPGEAGCHLVNGEAIANTMAVPGFLGQDYVCGGAYGLSLTPDVDDLDDDGDTEELIILSDGMQAHMMEGGPHGHTHRHGPGMMGPHMGWAAESDPVE